MSNIILAFRTLILVIFRKMITRKPQCSPLQMASLRSRTALRFPRLDFQETYIIHVKGILAWTKKNIFRPVVRKLNGLSVYCTDWQALFAFTASLRHTPSRALPRRERKIASLLLCQRLQAPTPWQRTEAAPAHLFQQNDPACGRLVGLKVRKSVLTDHPSSKPSVEWRIGGIFKLLDPTLKAIRSSIYKASNKRLPLYIHLMTFKTNI